MADELCSSFAHRTYPVGVGRHILRAAQNHFSGNLQSIRRNSNQGRAGGVPPPGPCEYFPRMLQSVFGEERLAAVLSGIAPSTRSKYINHWRHWESFTSGRGMEPWIVRTSPDWDDVLIDFILFETRVMGNTVDVVKVKIPGIRFWHLLIGFPDFTVGGRYLQVLKSARRSRSINRKIPASVAMLERLNVVQSENPTGLNIGILTAAVIGFSSC